MILKFALTAPLLIILLSCDQKPKTELEKESYAYGYQLAQSAKKSNFQLNPAMVETAVKDVMNGRTPALSEDEIQRYLLNLSRKAEQQRFEMNESRLKDEKNFIENYMKGSDVQRTPRGVFYKVIKNGEKKSSKNKSIAKLHYVGSLSDGRVFDSTHMRGQPAQLKISSLPIGWQELIELMPIGAKWEAVVPPELAYGPSGSSLIPPHSAIKLEIELLDIMDQLPKE